MPLIFFFLVGACNFDTRTLCSWSNRQDDDFDWSIQHNGTPSTGTGPTRDHTQGNTNGFYVYIETSAPRSTGQKAYLQSPTFPPNNKSPQCFKFWYNMNGRRMGTLNVYLATNMTASSVSKTKLWTLTGSQGTAWKSAQFTVQSSTGYRVC